MFTAVLGLSACSEREGPAVSAQPAAFFPRVFHAHRAGERTPVGEGTVGSQQQVKSLARVEGEGNPDPPPLGVLGKDAKICAPS